MATARQITKIDVDALVPGGVVWDGEIKGLGCRRQADARVFLLKYRFGGRQRVFTIGRHGSPWTVKTARTEAKRLLGRIADGDDPAATRDADRSSGTVADLLGRFVVEHAEAKRKPSTAREYRRIVDRVISPAIGRLKVAEVTRADIARLHDSMAARPYQANRVLALSSVFFNWTERHGHREDGTNPCRHVERFPEKARERFLSEAELQRLGDALVRAGRENAATPWSIAAVRLLILTGARLGEILTLRWEYVDLERAVLRLPDSKTGAKTIRLNAPALAVLADLPRMEGNPHVIVGHVRGAHLVNLEKPWRRIRELAGLPDLRLHDLRHSFASVGAGLGASLPTIGRLLGHTVPQTTARYAHVADDPARQLAERIGERIDAAMRGAPAAVERLRR